LDLTVVRLFSDKQFSTDDYLSRAGVSRIRKGRQNEIKKTLKELL